MAGDLDHITITAMHLAAARLDPSVSASEFVRLIAQFAKKVSDDTAAAYEPRERPDDDDGLCDCGAELSGECAACNASAARAAKGSESPAKGSESSTGRQPQETAASPSAPDAEPAEPSRRRVLDDEDRAAIARRVAEHRAERVAGGFKHLKRGFMSDLARELGVAESRVVTIDLDARHAAGMPVDESIRARFKKVATPAPPKSDGDAGAPPASTSREHPAASQTEAPPAETELAAAAASQTTSVPSQEGASDATAAAATDSSERGSLPVPAPDTGGSEPAAGPADNRIEIRKRIAAARKDAAALGNKILPAGTIAALAREFRESDSTVLEIGKDVPSIADFVRERQERRAQAHSTAARMDAAANGQAEKLHPSLRPAKQRVTPSPLRARELEGKYGS